MTTFGLLPLLFAYLVSRHRNVLWPNDVMLRFCVAYGLVSFVIAPELGASVPRLFAYAWPLFVVAVPILFSRLFSLPRGPLVALLSIHVAIAWTPVAYRYQIISTGPALIVLLLVLAGYLSGWMLLRSNTERLQSHATYPNGGGGFCGTAGD